MSEPLSDRVLEAFLRIGYKEKDFLHLNMDSCIRQDFRLDGDSLEEDLEFIQKHYGVDFSDFVFERYAHPEGELLGGWRTMQRFLHWWNPDQNPHPDARPKLQPLKFRKLDRAIAAKRWIEDD